MDRLHGMPVLLQQWVVILRTAYAAQYVCYQTGFCEFSYPEMIKDQMTAQYHPQLIIRVMRKYPPGLFRP